MSVLIVLTFVVGRTIFVCFNIIFFLLSRLRDAAQLASLGGFAAGVVSALLGDVIASQLIQEQSYVPLGILEWPVYFDLQL